MNVGTLCMSLLLRGEQVMMSEVRDNLSNQAEVETCRDQAEVETRSDQAEVETRRNQAEVETRRDQAEVETRSDQAEVETRRNQAEVETRRDQAEVETGRDQEEVETCRDQAEVETCRDQAEVETGRDQEEVETCRDQEEVETCRDQAKVEIRSDQAEVKTCSDQAEVETCRDQAEVETCSDQAEVETCSEHGHPSSADASPPPSAEASGLLSLPWEVVTQIASHLPAQCVMTVLPKVCHALGNVGKDSSTWQLRAHRLIGSRCGFPVGPREDFDWSSACLEMEQLITCWSGQAHLVARRTQEDEEEREQVRQQQRAGRDGEPVADGQEDGREDEVEGVGVEAQEVAHGGDEGMEVAREGEADELQPVVGGDQPARLREELEERLADDAAALMEEERDHRMAYDANEELEGSLNHHEDVADPRNLGNGIHVEMEQPSPALEFVPILSGHIAQINSVLLVGGEGAVCATGSRDWNVKLWDLQAASGGTLLHTLGGRGNFSTHRGWAWCLASQGPLLASGGFDSTVRLWDLQAGGAERGVIRTGAAVLCLSCQTDVLLAGTFNKRVSMYDTRAAEPLVKSLRLHGSAVMCLAADDKYIISGSKDCTVVVYDRRAGKSLKKLQLSSYLYSMSYSGCEVWAGDNGGMLHTFSMQAGTLKPLSQFDVGHTALVTGIHRSTGSLYTCSSDRTVKVHIPCAPPRTLCTMRHQSGVSGLSVEAGVFVVASGDVSVSLEVWRPRK